MQRGQPLQTVSLMVLSLGLLLTILVTTFSAANLFFLMSVGTIACILLLVGLGLFIRCCKYD